MKLASIAANGQKGVSHLPDNLEQTLQNLHTIILADLQQVGQLVAQVHSESISSCLHDHFPASGEPREQSAMKSATLDRVRRVFTTATISAGA